MSETFSASWALTPPPVAPEHRPRCRVLLGPGLARENQLPKLALGVNRGAVDISGMVKGVRTTSTLTQPNGPFELRTTFQSLGDAIRELKLEQRSLNQLLVPENTVEIALDRGVKGSDLEIVTQGTVSRIYECTAVGDDGTVEREVRLAGESWGKILVRHEIPAHRFTSFIQSDKEMTKRLEEGAVLRGTVGYVTKRIFDLVFLKRVSPLQIAQQDMFVFDVDQELLDSTTRGFIETDSVWLRQGKFWNELRGLADDPWNELYADYLPHWSPQGPTNGLEYVPPDPGSPPRFMIRLRRRPFDEARWGALNTHVIRDDDVRYQDAALADDERVNWVVVELSARIKAQAEFPLDYIYFATRRFDQQSAEAHGAQLLRRKSAYCDLPGGRSGESILQDPDEQDRLIGLKGDVFGLLDNRSQELWDMFSINHRLWRAAWVVAGHPEIRIGERVQNQREPSSFFVKEEYARRTYYVEQVVHDYLEGHHFWTHLGLTRGQPIDGFIRPAVDGKDTGPGSSSDPKHLGTTESAA